MVLSIRPATEYQLKPTNYTIEQRLPIVIWRLSIATALNYQIGTISTAKRLIETVPIGDTTAETSVHRGTTSVANVETTIHSKVNAETLGDHTLRANVERWGSTFKGPQNGYGSSHIKAYGEAHDEEDIVQKG